jgi:hypothetical protein
MVLVSYSSPRRAVVVVLAVLCLVAVLAIAVPAVGVFYHS